MTWWDYATSVAGSASQDAIAKAAGVSAPTVSRWRIYTPKPEVVAAFARAYNRPVLEAFVAAGFLTPDEAGERPTAPPSLTGLSDDDLISEVRRRMTGGAAIQPSGITPIRKRPEIVQGHGVVSRAARPVSTHVGYPEYTSEAEESQDPGGFDPA